MSKEPRGTITTLLDLTDRNAQENDLFPLNTNETWFTRSKDRKVISFVPQLQNLPFRGPAAFGQKFTFDLGSLLVGDLLFGTVLQIKLGHWLDLGTRNKLAAGVWKYTDPSTAWEYANALGSSCIELAELEIDGKTLETIDGDFINTWSRLFSDYNTQLGVSYDHIGELPIPILRQVAAPESSPPRTVPLLIPNPREFPTEDGYIHCPLPFFYGRVRYQEALPLISIKEGNVKLKITLRPFSEVVRQIRGYRDSCCAVPLDTMISFTPTAGGPPILVPTVGACPDLESVTLLTHGAIVDGEYRQKLLRTPYEMLHRELQTFTFDEPSKYTINRRGGDSVTIQVSLEANNPVEEIIWFIRRKGVRVNNEWTNYSDKLETEWTMNYSDPIGLDPKFMTKPMLVSAKLQVNGITLLEADEQYFRQHIASRHKGGISAYSKYIYGISFAELPGGHQPTGSVNASRTNSFRLTMDIQGDVLSPLAPLPESIDDASWEVKVFCNAMNWMRYENGLANAVFED